MSEPTDSKKDSSKPIKLLSLERVAELAKLVVEEGLKESCTPETIRSVWEDSDYREYTVVLNTPRFNTACRKVQRMASMFPLAGIYLGSRDLLLAKFNFDVMRVRGQRVLILRSETELSQIEEVTVWGHGPGDRGDKVEIPFWADSQFMAIVKKFPLRDGGEGEGVELEYFQGSTPVSRTQLFEKLALCAQSPEMIEESFLYQPIVMRGKISTFGPLTKWKSTGKKVDAKDRYGQKIKLPNGTIKMIDERVRDEEGFPCIQGRINNPEEEIYTFTLTIKPLNSDVDTPNVVKVKFLNKKLGRHLIELNSHQRMFRDAFNRGTGTANDAFDHLTGTYRDTEVFIMGTVTRFNETDEVTWIDIEGTMLLALNMSDEQIEPKSESPVLSSTPQSTAAPTVPTVPVVPTIPAVTDPTPTDVEAFVKAEDELLAESRAAHTAEVAAVTEIAKAVEGPPVAVPPAAVAVPPASEEPVSLAKRLEAAIKESMELYGNNMTFEEFDDFGLCPEELVGAGSKVRKERHKMVEKMIAKVRADLGDSSVGSHGDVSGPTSVSTLTPEEAAAVDVDQVCSACDGPMTPHPHAHWEVCPENPKNKEKSTTSE